jgi:hypothetical protein
MIIDIVNYLRLRYKDISESPPVNGGVTFFNKIHVASAFIADGYLL